MTLINEIENYIPYNEQEESDKEIILHAIKNNNNILTRENKVMHITSSGYVLNKTKDKVLMIYHRIYNSWSWTGGHADGDEDLLYVATKEVKEETGIQNLKLITKDIFSLDILPVDGHYKKGKFVSPHLHLSVAYLFEGNEDDELVLNEEETKGVKWISIRDLHKACNEPKMLKVYDKFNEKINKLNEPLANY